MEIEKSHIRHFLDETLTEISRTNLPQHSHPCPHCRLPVRYPAVARDVDVEDFELIMESASKIMKKYKIEANLLAEIKAECIIAMVKNKGK